MESVKKVTLVKVAILGDSGVGKTCMLLRYLGKEYIQLTQPTIGPSFYAPSVTIQDLLVKLEIWDTAGQERFKALIPMCYRKANAAILVYDITNPQSFENLKNWVLEIKENSEEAITFSIVGSKMDLSKYRMVPKTEAIRYCNSIGGSYHECSALENQGIEEIFEKIALRTVMKANTKKPINPSQEHLASNKQDLSISIRAKDYNEYNKTKRKYCCGFI